MEFKWALVREGDKGRFYSSLDGENWRSGYVRKLGKKPRSYILEKRISEYELPSADGTRTALFNTASALGLDAPILKGVGVMDDKTKAIRLRTDEEIRMGFTLSEGVKIIEVPATATASAPTTPPKLELAVQTVLKPHVPAEFWFHEEKDIIQPLVMAVNKNINSLLIGETGCGKTSVVKYLAAKSKNGFRRINLNGETTVEDLVGRYVLNDKGEMVWIDGVLPFCMKEGIWICFDEINAALPEVKFVLQSVLDDDRYLVLTQKNGEIVHAHADFRFFGTMNPNYAGTHTLNRAFEDRFGVAIRCEYPNKSNEVKIIEKRTGHTNHDLLRKMVDVAQKCRNMYRKEEITTPFSTRRLIDWATADQVFGTLEAFRITCLNKMPVDEHITVLDVCDAVFPGGEFRKKLAL